MRWVSHHLFESYDRNLSNIANIILHSVSGHTPCCKDTETNPANTQKANISTKNTPYFELGTEWNAEKAEKTPIFAKKSAHNEQL